MQAWRSNRLRLCSAELTGSSQERGRHKDRNEAQIRESKSPGLRTVGAAGEIEPGNRLSGPTYHIAVYRASKNLLVPLHTPRANANEGMNSTATVHANRPAICPASARRTATPSPVSAATRMPAIHAAGNCRGRIRAQEKSSCSVPKRVSRVPRRGPRYRMGQIHAAANSGPRETSKGAANWAISKPPATTYHHQR